MRLTLLIAGLLLAFTAQAAPLQRPDFGDDAAEAQVVDKTLKGQFHQVRQTVVDRTSDLVVTTMGFLGVPYRRGGNTAETGFDCSGFVDHVYRHTLGISLPRTSRGISKVGKSVSPDELSPGDLVFYNTQHASFSHVGIYVGDGKFVHSPRTGESVRTEDMQTHYWKTRYEGARRIRRLLQ